MTREEYDEGIDVLITDKTEPDSITPAIEGEAFKFAADYTDEKLPYKSYQSVLSIDSGVGTLAVPFLDEIGAAYTVTNPSNGRLRLTSDQSVFTVNKTFFIPSIWAAGSSTYFINGGRVSATIFDIYITLHDGTQSTTPNIPSQLIEFRVYN